MPEAGEKIMDALLKKYADKIVGAFPTEVHLRLKKEIEGYWTEKLLLQFLLEYIELRGNKNAKNKY